MTAFLMTRFRIIAKTRLKNPKNPPSDDEPTVMADLQDGGSNIRTFHIGNISTAPARQHAIGWVRGQVEYALWHPDVEAQRSIERIGEGRAKTWTQQLKEWAIEMLYTWLRRQE